MAHEDKGKYFKKHPEGTTVSDKLKEAVQKSARDNNVSCKAAEKISQSTGFSIATHARRGGLSRSNLLFGW